MYNVSYMFNSAKKDLCRKKLCFKILNHTNFLMLGSNFLTTSFIFIKSLLKIFLY